MTSITDAHGHITNYEYDDRGPVDCGDLKRMAPHLHLVMTSMPPIRTDYTYDKIGNLKILQDASEYNTYYNYTDLYQLENITDPLNHFTSYTYDELEIRRLSPVLMGASLSSNMTWSIA